MHFAPFLKIPCSCCYKDDCTNATVLDVHQGSEPKFFHFHVECNECKRITHIDRYEGSDSPCLFGPPSGHCSNCWQSSERYKRDDEITLTPLKDGFVHLKCIKSGRSGDTEPVWDGQQDSIIDGSCAWVVESGESERAASLPRDRMLPC